MAVEKLSDVADAAVSEFDGLGGGIKAALSFVEGRKSELHGTLDRKGVWRKHDGIQPKGREILFQAAYLTAKLSCQKGQMGQLIKFRCLAVFSTRRLPRERFWASSLMGFSRADLFLRRARR